MSDFAGAAKAPEFDQRRYSEIEAGSPARPAQVEEATTRLSKISLQLGNQIATLEQRLEAVLQPFDVPSDPNATPREILVPLAGRIDDVVVDLQRHEVRIASMLSRLEV